MRRLFGLVLIAAAAFAGAQQKTLIRMIAGPYQGIPPQEATDPRSLARRGVFEEFHKRNPDLQVVNAGGLELQGANEDSMFLMAMAGDTAPDVFYVNFKQYYNYVDQGFCRRLDDLVAQDKDSVARMNPDIEKVIRSYDGHLYAIPFFQVAMALYYRKDLFIQAGLDPSRPPQTWDEFLEYGRRITESKPGRSGFVFSSGPGGRAYWWVDFVWQAGGQVVVPGANGYWRSALDSDQTATALDFYRRLVAEKWTGKDGKTYGPVANISSDYGRDVLDDKVGMWFSYTNDVVLNMTDMNPALLGIAAMPAGPAGRKNEINAGMWAINARITDPKKLEACWRFIKFFSGDEAARINTERFVDLGLGRLVNPTWLEKFGHKDILAEVDPTFVAANREVFKDGQPEPYGRNCQQAYIVMDSALDRAVLEPNTPAREILHAVSKEMDAKMLGFVSPEVQQERRIWALVIVTLGLILVGAITMRGIKRIASAPAVTERLPAGLDRRAVSRFMAWTIAPAALSIVVWSYYPLTKGLLMAFQDYRIMNGVRWVGLDNFIAVFASPIFYRSILNSFLYVGLSLAIGFFLPIFLALALNEIPRGKVFFRTVFYLPAMTSPIVITFLWRQFYEKSETGILNSILAAPTDLLNRVLAMIHVAPIDKAHDWLGNPTLAMFSVVLPGIWAGAGPGSILYLAALKNIPGERYEAADIDGASWVAKIRHIVMPGLRPLILINLLGVFIAGFKTMDTVFILTGGGPLYATHTIGLEIWTNAFMFLKFGYATAAAWVMGAILIGFTIIQIKRLLGLKFQAAGATS